MPKPLSDKIHPRLASQLKELGYRNLKEVSEGTGIPYSTVHKILSGDGKAKAILTYVTLAKSLGLTVEDLGGILAS